MADLPIASDEEWLSAHLFLSARPGAAMTVYGELGDAAATRLIAPFIAYCRAHGWLQRYFFIRYREEGWHLRLRLQARSTALNEVIRTALIRFVRDVSPGAIIEGDVGVDPSPDSLIAAVRWIEYVPEVDRYGGSTAIRVAEEHFCAASDAALPIVAQCGGRPRSWRLGKALLSMLAVSHPFVSTTETISKYFESYAIGYLSAVAHGGEDDRSSWTNAVGQAFTLQEEMLIDYVGEAWARLGAGESIAEPIDRLATASRRAFESLRRIDEQGLLTGGGSTTRVRAMIRIFGSYMHMMNNRLGVTIGEEAYLAQLCARAFQSGASASIATT